MNDSVEKVVDVAIGVVVRSCGAAEQVLVARRPDDKVLGGLWEFPGGKIEPGETAADCLVREFAEELAIDVQPGAAMVVIEHRYDHAVVRLHPYWCSLVDPEAEAENVEVAEHQWVEGCDLGSLAFPAANGGLVRMVVDVLNGRRGR